jgi:hypothetical protein
MLGQKAMLLEVNKDKNSVIRQLVSQQGQQVRKQMQAVTLEQH